MPNETIEKRIPLTVITAQMIVARNKAIIEAKQNVAYQEQRLADVLSSVYSEHGIDPRVTLDAAVTPEPPYELVLTLPVVQSDADPAAET